MNNKQKLKIICSCGNNHEALLSDIKRGKLCQTCKVKKYKETCLEQYGEDNVSKVFEILDTLSFTLFLINELFYQKLEENLLSWIMNLRLSDFYYKKRLIRFYIENRRK